MPRGKRLEKLPRTLVKNHKSCKRQPSSSRPPLAIMNDTRSRPASVSMENLIASVDSMISTNPPLENTPSIPAHSAPVARQPRTARQQSWTYRGLTQVRSPSQSKTAESFRRAPSTMASPKTIDTPPPSPLPRARRPSTQSTSQPSSKSHSSSIDLQHAHVEAGIDPICAQCDGHGTLTKEQYDLHMQREAKYREIAQTNHELRRTLDLSNKRMNILLAQFRQGQEDTDNTHQQLELLQAELEEARVYQLDLMEQNHALRAAATPIDDHHHFPRSPDLPPNAPDSPIDRQLSLMESQETVVPRSEVLERRIQGLLNTIDEQDALIDSLATKLATSNLQGSDDLEDVSDNLDEHHPFPARRGAVSIEPNSYLGRQITQSVQNSPLSSPQLTRSQPHETPAPETCPSVFEPDSEEESDSESDDEGSGQASAHSHIHPENSLHIYYTLPSPPHESVINQPSPSSFHSAPLKRAKRLPHPAEVWTSPKAVHA